MRFAAFSRRRRRRSTLSGVGYSRAAVTLLGQRTIRDETFRQSRILASFLVVAEHFRTISSTYVNIYVISEFVSTSYRTCLMMYLGGVVPWRS